MTSRLLALLRVDLRAAVRDNEQLLLTVGIPAALLVFFSTVDVLPTGKGDPIQFLAPSVLALAVLSMAFVRLGQYEEAADWALKAVARPNAHVLIQQIAAFCLALAGRIDDGRVIAAAIRRARPGYRVDEFLHAFKFPSDTEAVFRRAAKKLGLD